MRLMLDGGFFFFFFCCEILQPAVQKKKGWRIQQMAFGEIFYEEIAISKEKKLKSRQI